MGTATQEKSKRQKPWTLSQIRHNDPKDGESILAKIWEGTFFSPDMDPPSLMPNVEIKAAIKYKLKECRPYLSNNPALHVDSEIGLIDPWDIWVEYCTPETIREIGEVVEEHGIKHVKNSKAVRLCCPESTKRSSSVLMWNTTSLAALFVASEDPIYNIKARTFVPGMTPEDEKFELAMIGVPGEEMYPELEKADIPNPVYGNEEFEIYNSPELAQQAVEKYNTEQMKKMMRDAKKGGSGTLEFDCMHTDVEGTIIFDKSKKDDKYAIGGGLFYRIVHAYSNGKTVIAGCNMPFPILDYFKAEEGFRDYEVGACPNCIDGVADRLAHRTKMDIRNNIDWWSLRSGLAHSYGYRFNLSRVKGKILGLKIVEPSKE